MQQTQERHNGESSEVHTRKQWRWF